MKEFSEEMNKIYSKSTEEHMKWIFETNDDKKTEKMEKKFIVSFLIATIKLSKKKNVKEEEKTLNNLKIDYTISEDKFVLEASQNEFFVNFANNFFLFFIRSNKNDSHQKFDGKKKKFF